MAFCQIERYAKGGNGDSGPGQKLASQSTGHIFVEGGRWTFNFGREKTRATYFSTYHFS